GRIVLKGGTKGPGYRRIRSDNGVALASSLEGFDPRESYRTPRTGRRVNRPCLGPRHRVRAGRSRPRDLVRSRTAIDLDSVVKGPGSQTAANDQLVRGIAEVDDDGSRPTEGVELVPSGRRIRILEG